MALSFVARLRRAAARAAALGALLALASACDDGRGDPPPLAPQPGALDVAVSGLPGGATPNVTVLGPGGFSRTLTASQTLEQLAPGPYTVTAASVTVGESVYRATVAAAGGSGTPSAGTLAVQVRSGATAAVTATYSLLQLALELVASGLSNPVHLASPTGDARLFVVEQPGRVRVLRNGQLLATPFLDIAARVRSGGEEGLLSVAFDPAFATNGFFYVYFTNTAGDIAVERYSAPAGADVASPTPTSVLTIPHPTFGNHNGGLLAFGPDGMLYLGTGDGGGGGDPFGNARNLASLLGKLLRLDVRTLPYTVPPTNPFVGQAGRRGEIWAYGLRNPWRFDFDTPGGAASGAMLYVADVGQGAWEEVNVAPAGSGGLNYGWNTMEGTHCYPADVACNVAGLHLPAIEYDHGQGCSITGGYVYRGAALPELAGHYFYSDYCGGWLASMTGNAAGNYTTRRWDVPNVGNVTSFGEDAAGELYLLSAAGTVHRLVRR